MKTQAALLVETGKPLVLAEIEIPPLKPGQVLVQIAYSGACGTQVMEWRGDKGEDKWVPHCLGHEGSGVGAVYNVLKAQLGDAVAGFGTGGIGLNALMAAALVGAMPVIGIDPNPTRRALAKIYGATHVIDPSQADVLGEIKRIVPQ